MHVFGVCIDWSGWQCENGQLDAARAPRSSWQPLNNTPLPTNAPCILKGQGKYCCRLLVTSNSILPPQHKQITPSSALSSLTSLYYSSQLSKQFRNSKLCLCSVQLIALIKTPPTNDILKGGHVKNNVLFEKVYCSNTSKLWKHIIMILN